jgi:hypothetical protein
MRESDTEARFSFGNAEAASEISERAMRTLRSVFEKLSIAVQSS